MFDFDDGDVDESPNLPFVANVKRLAPDDDAIERRLLLPAAPVIASMADGVVEPRPSLPLTPRLSMLTPVDEATANGLTVVVPRTRNVEDGVVEPIPTLPSASTVKYCTLLDDATANGLSVVVPRTRNPIVEDVPLTPDTTALSIRVPIPKVLADTQRDINPVVPPETEAVMLSDDVATQRVDVPVDCRSIPSVPDAFVVS